MVEEESSETEICIEIVLQVLCEEKEHLNKYADGPIDRLVIWYVNHIYQQASDITAIREANYGYSTVFFEHATNYQIHIEDIALTVPRHMWDMLNTVYPKLSEVKSFQDLRKILVPTSSTEREVLSLHKALGAKLLGTQRIYSLVGNVLYGTCNVLTLSAINFLKNDITSALECAGISGTQSLIDFQEEIVSPLGLQLSIPDIHNHVGLVLTKWVNEQISGNNI